jgi:predicted MFS family arabinose efflux permease
MPFDTTLTATLPGARLPRALVALFACACGLSVANVYYAQPLLDALAAEFAIGPGAAGAIVTATQLGSAMALLLLVPLGDQLNRRRLILMQTIALISSLLWVSLAQDTVTLLIGMLIVGLLGTAMTQGLIAYAATCASSEERGQVVGTVQGGVFMGLLLARLFAGFISDLAGWRGVYLTSALMMAVLAVMLWRVLPDQRPSARPLPYPQLILSMFSLLREEPVLQVRGLLALLMFAVFSIFWSALVFPLSTPPYALSHTAIGTFGLVGVVGALAAARAGRWADRGLGQWVTGLALLLLALSWLPLWFTLHSMAWLVLGIIALDLAGQAIHVTNQSMILHARPDAQSRVIGGYMLFYAAGSGLGAVASTATYAAFGWSGVCLLGMGVSLIALLFWAATLRYQTQSNQLR